MASAHHLLAAAFSLCGLLFLLHVVTVNSIVCKNCNYEDAGCFSGNVREFDCGANNTCDTTVIYFKNGVRLIYRDCVTGNYWKDECKEETDPKICYYYCDTDNCNNVSYEPQE